MPCVSASLNFSASDCSTQVIVKAIKDLIPFELYSHKLMLFEAQKENKKLLHMKHAELFDYNCSQLDPIHHIAFVHCVAYCAIKPLKLYRCSLIEQSLYSEIL